MPGTPVAKRPYAMSQVRFSTAGGLGHEFAAFRRDLDLPMTWPRSARADAFADELEGLFAKLPGSRQETKKTAGLALPDKTIATSNVLWNHGRPKSMISSGTSSPPLSFAKADLSWMTRKGC